MNKKTSQEERTNTWNWKEICWEWIWNKMNDGIETVPFSHLSTTATVPILGKGLLALLNPHLKMNHILAKLIIFKTVFEEWSFEEILWFQKNTNKALLVPHLKMNHRLAKLIATFLKMNHIPARWIGFHHHTKYTCIKLILKSTFKIPPDFKSQSWVRKSYRQIDIHLSLWQRVCKVSQSLFHPSEHNLPKCEFYFICLE